ncbi:MAG: hypothetical protein KTR33_16790 [Gammaproteobacteria bacterium]|nr:hypothetical protein [Gammaproteobacteria bacterium]
MGTLFLVQIPETAGSNLRLAACRLWGSGKIVTDYGPSNRHTSESVLELIHLEQDFHGFKTWLSEQEIALFTSHAPLRSMRRIFPASDIITFLRHPVDLILQRYQSALLGGYKGGLIQFATLRVHRDIQSRFLRTVPLELLGFVGLSERFTESLTLLNEQYGCNLTALTVQDNVCNNALSELSDVTEADRSKLAELNAQDMELYATATELFDTRITLQEQQTPYVHGRVHKLNENSIEGWAVPAQSSEPCKIRLHINQECVAILPASEYLPALKERNVSRDGYVGFSHQFKQRLKRKDEVSCYIHCSEQLLTGPRRVNTK